MLIKWKKKGFTKKLITLGYFGISQYKPLYSKPSKVTRISPEEVDEHETEN